MNISLVAENLGFEVPESANLQCLDIRLVPKFLKEHCNFDEADRPQMFDRLITTGVVYIGYEGSILETSIDREEAVTDQIPWYCCRIL